MTAGLIPVAGTSKNLQTFENTIAGQVVESEAVTPTRSDGVAFDALVLTYNSGTLSSAGSVTKAGRGKHLRVFATVDSSFTLNGGAVITLRAGTGHDEDLDGLIVDPVIAWVSGTLDIYISVVN